MKSKGFLLVEVIFCVAIISTGIVLIFQSYRTIIKALAISEDYLQAAMLLEKKYIEMQDQISIPAAAAISGPPFTLRQNTLSAIDERAVRWNQTIIEWSRNQKESAIETWCAVANADEKK
jgi:Tfp pilus assembly protein PilE